MNPGMTNSHDRGWMNYIEGTGAVVMDGDAVVTASAAFGGGSLFVSLTANGTSSDRLAVRTFLVGD
jgi:hypothetical protein